MLGIHRLGFTVAGGKTQHRSGDLVLAVGGKPAHRIHCLFEELGHGGSIVAMILSGKSNAVTGAPYSALTMPSVIFLASPSSIMVLSR